MESVTFAHENFPQALRRCRSATASPVSPPPIGMPASRYARPVVRYHVHAPSFLRARRSRRAAYVAGRALSDHAESPACATASPPAARSPRAVHRMPQQPCRRMPAGRPRRAAMAACMPSADRRYARCCHAAADVPRVLMRRFEERMVLRICARRSAVSSGK